MVSTSLSFSVWQACSALQTALILIVSDTIPSITTITFLSCESQPTSRRVFTQAAFVVRKGLARCLCHRTFYIPVSLINLVARIYLSVAFYRLWRSFSPAGTKNSCKYRNEILIMDHAKTTTTTTTTTKTNKQKIKITGNNCISRFLVERNYLAAFMHKRFRNYLLRVHLIVLTLKWNGI